MSEIIPRTSDRTISAVDPISPAPDSDQDNVVVSENVPEKPKRGRPRCDLYAPEKRAFIAALGLSGLYDRAQTERGKQNIDRRQHAVGVIMQAKDARLNWLWDEAAAMAGNIRIRETILTELGRIDDDDDLLGFALQICALKPKARDAVAASRRFRSCQRKEASALDLANELINTLNDYLKRFPQMPNEDVETALSTAWEQVLKSGAKEVVTT
jgi:hypothetical protein